MTLRGVDPRWLLYGVGAVALGVAAFQLYRLATGAAGAAGQVIGAADEGLKSAVGGVGSIVGLPTPFDTIDDAAQVRYIADRSGWFEASKWATALALFRASSVPEGQGVPPPINSPAARALGYDVVDETDRLLRRYPAPAPVLTWAEDSPGLTQSEQWGLPL